MPCDRPEFADKSARKFPEVFGFLLDTLLIVTRAMELVHRGLQPVRVAEPECVVPEVIQFPSKSLEVFAIINIIKFIPHSSLYISVIYICVILYCLSILPAAYVRHILKLTQLTSNCQSS